ncbi:MAG: knotted carbamoyltransferase YgeW [Candidatus Hydrogenedentota bacterium]
MSEMRGLVSKLKECKFSMYGKDFLLTWERSDADIKATLLLAKLLKGMHKKNISLKVFKSGIAISIFKDQSTRTRFSLASASNLLGLQVIDLDEGKSQIAHGETVRETANMVSFLAEVIGIRDDMYLGEGNKYMREVASALDDGYKNGVLHQRPVVINCQCDIDHPTQTLADLSYMIEYFGGIDKLRGKKIATTWAYSPTYGKPLSVPQGIIGLMTRFGMEVELANPKGYDLLPEVIEVAKTNAQRSGSKFTITNSMETAFKDADIVYPKSWAPLYVMQQRTSLLKEKNEAALKELEKHCLANNAKFKKWECNEKMMKLTKKGKALYMHCLPADISSVSCKEGEVSASVFEKYRIDTYKQAGYKPFIIAAMILLARFKDPVGVIDILLRKNNKRIT